MQKVIDLDEILCSGVVEVADYEFKLKIQKFNMADPIWLTKMQKVTWFGQNFVLGCTLRSMAEESRKNIPGNMVRWKKGPGKKNPQKNGILEILFNS